MGINLHAVAGPVVGAVNPNTTLRLYRNTGTGTTAPDGTRSPLYQALQGLAQVQPVGQKEIQHLAALNLSGNFKSVYLYGAWFGTVRLGQHGGDMVVIGGAVWLAVAQPEEYPGWSRILVQLQTDRDPTKMFGFQEMSTTQPTFPDAPMSGFP